MQNRLNVTSVPSIIFLDIVGYSKKANTEQIGMKDRLNAYIESALNGIDESDRILLDTGDGAGIAIWDVEPQRPLYVAMAIRDAILEGNQSAELPMFVRFGIHSGPVTVKYDINKQYNIVGDGINVTQRIMSFAGENQIMVSRSYYDNIFGIDTTINDMLVHQGVSRDKHSRQHDVYLLVSPEDQKESQKKEKRWNKLFRSQSKQVNKLSSRVNSIIIVVAIISVVLGGVILWEAKPDLFLNEQVQSTLPPPVPEALITPEVQQKPMSNVTPQVSAPPPAVTAPASLPLDHKSQATLPVVAQTKSNVKRASPSNHSAPVDADEDTPSDANLYDGGYLTKDESGQQVILYGDAAKEAKLRNAH